MMTLDYLEKMVAGLPKKVLVGKNGPYMTRYYLRANPEGGGVYIHQIHRSDEDEELHNHPWAGDSLILLGNYCEERRSINHTIFEDFGPGKVNRVFPDTYHRITLGTREVWTLFHAGQKVQDWGFWDKKTRKVTPWRDFILAKGLTPHGD